MSSVRFVLFFSLFQLGAVHIRHFTSDAAHRPMEWLCFRFGMGSASKCRETRLLLSTSTFMRNRSLIYNFAVIIFKDQVLSFLVNINLRRPRAVVAIPAAAAFFLYIVRFLNIHLRRAISREIGVLGLWRRRCLSLGWGGRQSRTIGEDGRLADGTSRPKAVVPLFVSSSPARQ